MIDHLPVILAAVFRLLSLLPLGIIFLSVFKTFWDKLHSINGLRPYRLIIMIVLMAIILDQLVYLYFDVKSVMMDIEGMIIVETPFLILNSGVMLIACLLLFYFFEHARAKEMKDVFTPKGGKK